MQPFGKGKAESATDPELVALRGLFRQLKAQNNLGEDVQRALAQAETTVKQSDTKGYRDLITAVGHARKQLESLDTQWAAYRAKWSLFLEESSRAWIAHLEGYEAGEHQMREKRKEMIMRIKQLREQLDAVHKRTMAADSGLTTDAAAEVELTETAHMEEDLVDTSDIDKLKSSVLGAVKAAKDNIEDRLRRARKVEVEDDDEVKLMEPAPKMQKGQGPS